MKSIITIQYLEDALELAQLDQKQVIDRLRAAREHLSLTHLLIGWNLPIQLLEACRKEAERLGILFMRWHPLLTGDSVLQPRPTWQTVGLTGQKIAGFHNLPEFTFMCPNNPEVQAAVLQRVKELLREGMYQGFFLDRIRFPSPAADLLNDLGCFCEHCCHKAESLGLDLATLRKEIVDLTSKEQGRLSLVRCLLNNPTSPSVSKVSVALDAFINFRLQTITDFVNSISKPLKENRMEIGLDCFSPSLTPMVGQDLTALSMSADWIKVMSYAHTLGPAGLPFELLGIFDFLARTTNLSESEITTWISETLDLPLPATRRSLEIDGLSPTALERELLRGVAKSAIPLLAGIELVDIKGITYLHDLQMQADLRAVKRANVKGLAISWDLWHIPLERLDLVNRIYVKN